MSLGIDITVSDTATPFLHELHEQLTDLTGLNGYIASTGEAGTRQYIRAAAADRHSTASSLGAQPTNYLSKSADLTESRHDAQGATITVHGAIFQRTFGDVTVTAKKSQWLTIPATAAAYGKSAREFNDLRVQFFGKGLMGLVKAEQSAVGTRRRSGFSHDQDIAGRSSAPLKSAARPEVYYWLKKSVVLPQDRGLLPSLEQYTAGAELAARDYLRKLQRDMGL